MNKTVTYELRCAKGCGQIVGYLTLPEGAPVPMNLNRQFKCLKDCQRK